MNDKYTVEIVTDRNISDTLYAVLCSMFEGLHYGEHHTLFRVYYTFHEQLTSDQMAILHMLKKKGMILAFATKREV